MTGCSYIFVTTPQEQAGYTTAGDCTTNIAAPVIDTLLTTTNLFSTLYVAGENNVANKGQAVGIGALATGFWLSSAIYGYYNTSKCAELRAESDPGPYRRPIRVRRRVPPGPYRSAPPLSRARRGPRRRDAARAAAVPEQRARRFPANRTDRAAANRTDRASAKRADRAAAKPRSPAKRRRRALAGSIRQRPPLRDALGGVEGGAHGPQQGVGIQRLRDRLDAHVFQERRGQRLGAVAAREQETGPRLLGADALAGLATAHARHPGVEQIQLELLDHGGVGGVGPVGGRGDQIARPMQHALLFVLFVWLVFGL